jgi:hypothetical protein
MKFFSQKLTHFSILDIYKCPNRVFESKIWRKFVTENLKLFLIHFYVIYYDVCFICIFLLGKNKNIWTFIIKLLYSPINFTVFYMIKTYLYLFFVIVYDNNVSKIFNCYFYFISVKNNYKKTLILHVLL